VIPALREDGERRVEDLGAALLCCQAAFWRCGHWLRLCVTYVTGN
jgi:hypothetical protein